jgi:hypothetical protein
MPPFYVLRDPDSIRALVFDGVITQDVQHDLKTLTERPLIIRTDGVDIPEGKREMLPRSDERRSLEDATRWLLGPFRQKIKDNDIASKSLVLIAHHFIPSLASVWARAEPGRPLVRIEALWGIPEGLYWFSHDTFEVDTQSPEISAARYSDVLLPAQRRRRHKETFVAPNEDGQWVPHKTASPQDWSFTITNDRWLSEIAWTTKLIAQAEKEPVSVMWFVGNHKAASDHRILPWFHSKCQLDTPKAAPRRKLRSSSDFRITSKADWETLLATPADAKDVERAIVEPADPDLIRHREFAEDLATLAKERGFVVELSGGILSHAYYVLKRSGAQVECVDLFGGDEEVIEFYKVVRDRVPAIIQSRGERAVTIRLTGDALGRVNTIRTINC